MNFILLLWHMWALDADEDELHLRTKEGSSSSAWAANVMILNHWRRQRIAELREQSMALRVLNTLGVQL